MRCNSQSSFTTLLYLVLTDIFTLFKHDSSVRHLVSVLTDFNEEIYFHPVFNGSIQFL